MAKFKCSAIPAVAPWTALCGMRRVVGSNSVGGSQICVYDTTGALVGSRGCSKTVGNCNCFYWGDTEAAETERCTGSSTIPLCEPDDAGAS